MAHALNEASAANVMPTGPAVTAPRTEAPAEGDPVGEIRIPAIGLDQVVVEGTNTNDLRQGPGHYTAPRCRVKVATPPSPDTAPLTATPSTTSMASSPVIPSW